MTYRDWFCIIQILIATAGTLVVLMYYFCVGPVYRFINSDQPWWIVTLFFLCCLYYVGSIISVVIEVIFGGIGNSDGGEWYIFYSVLAAIPFCLAICGFVLYIINLILGFFGMLHGKIKQKKGIK